MRFLKFKYRFSTTLNKEMEKVCCVPIEKIELIIFDDRELRIDFQDLSFSFKDNELVNGKRTRLTEDFKKEFCIALVDRGYSIWEIGLEEKNENELEYTIYPWVP